MQVGESEGHFESDAEKFSLTKDQLYRCLFG